MRAEPAAHPTADRLAAFGLGKLDDAAAATVAGHLETCPDCRRRAAAVSADSFVRGVRAAGDRESTPGPSKPLDGLAASIDPTVPPSGAVPPPGTIPPGLVGLPQYEIVRELGRGGMGVVYLARNTVMDRDEVLKVVNRAGLDRPGAADRFLQEIRAAGKLLHPNVVAAHAAVQAGPLLVLAMEYVPGEDLSRVVKARGPLPVANACYYAHQAALGLQHAHEQGMVHRDIKPHNLMLQRVGTKHVVKVLDFGLAKARSEKADAKHLTGSGAALGTPDYIAPEQARDAAGADIRADVYSLGCTLYHLLAGRPPFPSDSVYGVLAAHLQATAEPLDRVRPGVPAGLAAVVAKMMAKAPADRYPTPKDVADALVPFFKPAGGGSSHTFRASASVLTRAEPPAAPSPAEPAGAAVTAVPALTTAAAAGPVRRRPWWGLAAVVLAFAAAGLVGAWAGGVITVTTPDGLLVVTVTEPGAEVLVDGQQVTVVGADGKPVEIRVKPGTHAVEARKGDLVATGQVVTIASGTRREITIELKPLPGPAPAGKPDGDGFVPLFAGTLDPATWVESGGDGGGWRVDGGTLIGRGGPNLQDPAVLATRRTDYRNFTLRVVLAEPDIARMILFRGAKLDGEMAGYGVATAGKNPSGEWVAAGSLSKWCNIKGDGLVGAIEWADQVALPAGEPYTLAVTADGGVITSYVNGKKVAELPQDSTDQIPAGAILLMCRDGTTPRYRRIDIKELPADKAVPPAAGTTVLHRWLRTALNGRPVDDVPMQFVSGGRVLGPDGGETGATWRLTGGGRKLVLRWPVSHAPGGWWVDTYTSPDGVNFEGTNNDNRPAGLRGVLSDP